MSDKLARKLYSCTVNRLAALLIRCSRALPSDATLSLEELKTNNETYDSIISSMNSTLAAKKSEAEISLLSAPDLAELEVLVAALHADEPQMTELISFHTGISRRLNSLSCSRFQSPARQPLFSPSPSPGKPHFGVASIDDWVSKLEAQFGVPSQLLDRVRKDVEQLKMTIRSRIVECETKLKEATPRRWRLSLPEASCCITGTCTGTALGFVALWHSLGCVAVAASTSAGSCTGSVLDAMRSILGMRRQVETKKHAVHQLRLQLRRLEQELEEWSKISKQVDDAFIILENLKQEREQLMSKYNSAKSDIPEVKDEVRRKELEIHELKLALEAKDRLIKEVHAQHESELRSLRSATPTPSNAGGRLLRPHCDTESLASFKMIYSKGPGETTARVRDDPGSPRGSECSHHSWQRAADEGSQQMFTPRYTEASAELVEEQIVDTTPCHRSLDSCAECEEAGFSYVSCPLMPATAMRSFPSYVRFRRPNGQWVTADELRLEGGDVLQGLNRSTARVQAVVKHPPQEMEFVRLQTPESIIDVLVKHEVLVEAKDGTFRSEEAASFLKPNPATSWPPRVYSGQSFHFITGATLFKHTVQVIDVSFEEDDAAVLSWLVPCKDWPHKVHTGSAFASLGRSSKEPTSPSLSTTIPPLHRSRFGTPPGRRGTHRKDSSPSSTQAVRLSTGTT